MTLEEIEPDAARRDQVQALAAWQYTESTSTALLRARQRADASIDAGGEAIVRELSGSCRTWDK